MDCTGFFFDVCLHLFCVSRFVVLCDVPGRRKTFGTFCMLLIVRGRRNRYIMFCMDWTFHVLQLLNMNVLIPLCFALHMYVRAVDGTCHALGVTRKHEFHCVLHFTG